MIPGLELLPLAESEVCCGAAGSYSLTQPAMAERLAQRKTQNIMQARPDVVIAANAGCLLQIAKSLRNEDANIRAVHPADVLWASYSGRPLTELMPWR